MKNSYGINFYKLLCLSLSGGLVCYLLSKNKMEMASQIKCIKRRKYLSENTFLCNMVIFNRIFIKAFFVFSEDE